MDVLLAVVLRMEDLSFRLGVVLTAITLALWPMAKEVVVRAADDWVHEEAVKKCKTGSESYPVTAEVKKALNEVSPRLTVHYLAGGKSLDEAKASGRKGPAGDNSDKKPDEPENK